MADNKSGRDKQAHDADRRQRERALRAELERYDEAEPPVDDAELDEIEEELESVSFPATGAELVTVVGERRVTAGEESYALEDLLPANEVETFETPEVVRVRIRRPTVASAMKRIVEAADAVRDTEFSPKRRDAYEKSLRAMASMDADDEDSGVRALRDWILDRIEEKGKLPGSRDIRRQGAKIARGYGYEVRNDEWLGV